MFNARLEWLISQGLHGAEVMSVALLTGDNKALKLKLHSLSAARKFLVMTKLQIGSLVALRAEIGVNSW